MAGFYDNTYNPDVLLCLANLSNDEVFTPPDVANQILNMLPQELFSDPNTKFLDPACKSGVFLREIAKRLIVGLANTIPDLQERIDHIMHKQLYAIAITELTAMLSRRSVYCSKYPNGPFAVSRFETAQGNIKFHKIQHTWKDGKCVYCGASQSEYDRDASLETHAYEFIHFLKPEEIFNMKFDVIVSNPPYQLSDGGNTASAMPIYQKFVAQAIKLNPQYISMIIPSRWYCGGRGLEDFRTKMLSDGNIRELHDYKKSGDCFPGIRNGGGICYFLWDKKYKDTLCKIVEHGSSTIEDESVRALNEFGNDIFIRNTKTCNIIRKIVQKKEKSLSEYVYRQKPYGFRTNFSDFDKDGTVKVYTKKAKCGFSFVRRNKIIVNENTIDKWKVVTSRSTSVPEEDNGQVLRMSQTFIVEPNAVVTESYVLVSVFESKNEAENLYSYIKTKFFRFLCQPTIVSPDVSKRTFVFVPVQDFSKPWTDEELYKKYNLTDDEIAFIESMIKPMDLNGGDT